MSVPPDSTGTAPIAPDAAIGRAGSPSWQLFPNGLLVFERVLEPSGPSHLLVSRLEICTHPGCTCREMTLGAVELELDAPPDTFDELRNLLDHGESKFFQIDPDFGLVDRIRGDDPRPSIGEDWLAFLRAHVDGELLDRLHERWIQAKGVTSREGWSTIDWNKRDPGEMVVWEEMFPDDRVDHFLSEGGRVFFASEHYCRKAGCTCGEARVGFTEIEAGGKYRDVGSVRVGLPDGDIRKREAPRRYARILDELWGAFQRRHHVGARLAERNRRVQLIGARVAPLPPSAPCSAPSAATPRVGRNDPCPCGSGKKFKRCCAR